MPLVVTVNLPNRSSNITHYNVPSINNVCLGCSGNVFLHRNRRNVGLKAQRKYLSSKQLGEILCGVNSDVKFLLECNENENIYICHQCSLRVYQMSNMKKKLNALQTQLSKLLESFQTEERILKPGIERFLTTFLTKSENKELRICNEGTKQSVVEIIPVGPGNLQTGGQSPVIPPIKSEYLGGICQEEISRGIPSINIQDEIQIKIETEMDVPTKSDVESNKSEKETHRTNMEDVIFEVNQEIVGDNSSGDDTDEDESHPYEDVQLQFDSDGDWCYNSETDEDSEISDDSTETPQKHTCKLKTVNTININTKNTEVSMHLDSEHDQKKQNVESADQISSNGQRKRKVRASSHEDSTKLDVQIPNSISKSSDKKRASYNVEFKLKCIDHVEKITGSNRRTAAHFGICEKLVRTWRKEKDRLRNYDKSAKRFIGAGMKVKDRKLEQELVEWVNIKKKKGYVISAKALMTQALQRSTNPDFKASIGWATGFMKRHGLHLYNKKTSSRQQQKPENNPEPITAKSDGQTNENSCSEIVENTHSLVSHIQEECTVTLSDRVCSASYNTKSALNFHNKKCMPSNKSNRMLMKYKCTQCGKLFSVKRSLLTHMKKLHKVLK